MLHRFKVEGEEGGFRDHQERSRAAATGPGETIVVYKVENEAGDFFACAAEDMPEWLPYVLVDHEVGSRFTVTVEEWSRAKYDALPAWDGW